MTKYLILFSFSFLLGLYIGNYLTKNQFSGIEKVTTSINKTENKNKNKKILKNTKKILHPDGKIEINVEKKVDEIQNNQITKNEVKIIKIPKDWNIGVLGFTNLNNLKPEAGIIIQRRIVGDLYIGVIGFTTKQVAVTITHGF